MSVSIQGPFAPIVFAWRWEAASPGQLIELRDPLSARAWLGRIAADAGAMARLRRLAAERGATPGFGLDDDEVLNRLAGWIANGDIRIGAEARGALSSWGAGDAAEEQAAPASAKRAVTELTWITIELVGEDDKPIPGERYRIELPDGTVREGRLDGSGLARVRGIEEPGQCVVTFPDLDEEAWKSIGTTAEP